MVDAHFHEVNRLREERDAAAGITQINGWYWPVEDRDCRPAMLREAEPAVATYLRHTEGRECVVQAGGCIGVFPVMLADHFRKVVTFEPDPMNFACLSRNVDARDSLRRVKATNAALGDRAGLCSMDHAFEGNVGAHRIVLGGDIPVLTIDSLGLDACDGIFLDIEGYELPALRGAEETIRRFSPTVAIEDKGLGEVFGIATEAAVTWLEGIGYRLVDTVGRDKVFRRTA